MRRETGRGGPVISMERVTVSYNDHPIIKDFSWNVYRGENWIITGPNGSGKSTLFRLLTGDNSQVYANTISIFGRRRGTGDNLWEIRRRFGFLSTELHMGYRGDVPAVEAVLSGFFDSVGLFSAPNADHELEADKWIERIGLGGREQDHFAWFSYGEQRLILLARALIKEPELLLLDEPLQGLDPHNRKRFLSVLTGEAESAGRSILLITHYEEEVLELCPGLFTKTLRL
jgi:molybdate transport system ATP-binding protein